MLSLPFLSFQFIFPHILSYLFIFFHVLSFPCPRHFLFFPFMSFKLQEIPKSKNYTSFLLNHQFKKYLDQTLSHLGTGIPHKGPKNRLVKAVKKIFMFFFFEVVRISFPYMCIQFRFFHVIHFFFMSFHELKLDASPNLQTTKFVPFFDVLFEKDKTKAYPTPSQLGKGAPHEESVKGD